MTSDLEHGAGPERSRRIPAQRIGPKTATDRAPLYARVYRDLRATLLEGEWTVGASLPSESELSDRFGVSRITVRHALRLLESEGYIRKARARRATVVATAPAPQHGWMVESMDDIIAMVGDARLEVKSWSRENSAAEAALFGLPANIKLYCLRSALVRENRPYTLSIIFFPPEIGARLSRDAFDDPVVFRVLQRELGIRMEDVRLTIWAELADVQDAAALGCEIGSALLVTQLVYRDASGAPVEVAYGRSLASEARLSTRLTTGLRRA